VCSPLRTWKLLALWTGCLLPSQQLRNAYTLSAKIRPAPPTRVFAPWSSQLCFDVIQSHKTFKRDETGNAGNDETA